MTSPLIQFLKLGGDRLGIMNVESLGLHIDDVPDVFQDAVPQGRFGGQKDIFAREFLRRDPDLGRGDDHRPDLEETKPGGLPPALVESQGELDLHHPLQRVLAELQQLLQHGVERQEVELEDRREVDDPGAFFGDSVDDLVVLGPVGGGEKLKSPVPLRVLQD